MFIVICAVVFCWLHYFFCIVLSIRLFCSRNMNTIKMHCCLATQSIGARTNIIISSHIRAICYIRRTCAALQLLVKTIYYCECHSWACLKYRNAFERASAWEILYRACFILHLFFCLCFLLYLIMLKCVWFYLFFFRKQPTGKYFSWFS